MPAAKVRKAVFPAAGLGTRFLPATKAQPKEMLPLVDKPIIQYGVEEAVHSWNQKYHHGHGPRQIGDRRSLRRQLRARESPRNPQERKDLLKIVQAKFRSDRCFLHPAEGSTGIRSHAVLRAQELVGPGTVCRSPCRRRDRCGNALHHASFSISTSFSPRRCWRSWRFRGKRFLPMAASDGEPVSHNGSNDKVFRIRDLVEKPQASEAPSNLAIIGRYILTHDVFDSISSVEPGAGGEIQLTDALRLLLQQPPDLCHSNSRANALRRGG